MGILGGIPHARFMSPVCRRSSTRVGGRFGFLGRLGAVSVGDEADTGWDDDEYRESVSMDILFINKMRRRKLTYLCFSSVLGWLIRLSPFTLPTRWSISPPAKTLIHIRNVLLNHLAEWYFQLNSSISQS